MSVHSLIYISQAVGVFSEEALHRLHALSERNNRQRDITGALGFTGRYFLQYIEGRNEALSDVMRTIHCDARHANLLVCTLAPAAKRRFAQWSMRYFDSHALEADVRKVHESGVLSPTDAEWLVGRMIHALQPGHSLHMLDG